MILSRVDVDGSLVHMPLILHSLARGTAARTFSSKYYFAAQVFLVLILGSKEAFSADPTTYDYRVLATSRTSTMEKEMNEAGSVGYGFMGVMGGETGTGGKEVVVVMGKRTGAKDSIRKKYQLLAAQRTGTMQKEMQQAGEEGFGQEGKASRTLGWDEIIAWQPEVVFIACCGFSVDRTLNDVSILQSVPGCQDLPAIRLGRVFVTDGSQYFSRPGPRLVDSLEILAYALHPEVHPLPAGLPAPLRIVNPDIGDQVFGRSA